MGNGIRAYETPVFSDTDPLICHSLQLRPSLWAAVFGALGELGQAWAWRQDDPASATVSEVIAEIQKATDEAIFSGCIMIGEIKELALADVPDWLLRCDGATYAVVDYPELASVIHPNFFVDEDNFRVPDRGRRLGMDGLLIASQEGEETHTLTTGEMPAHYHVDNGSSVTGVFVAPGEVPAVIALAPGVTSDAGGGAAHNNIQPVEGSQFYIVARYPHG